ncbi:Protein of unknown function [Streptomyces sp. WMMB 714]|uniref:DUF3152 domain-containing protein n=1 Tax=Streptomyces sp. WMMB 714 TaxID=1286822 RepID=UPI000823ECF1|nr:DUF3152 domain-containing protein [Streptomyces sp. WMMB 714]SCK12897.1 Protein of unknown function [Streptomyces sp. WMMB 714]
MGRHSRKGRAKAGDPPDRAVQRDGAAPAYGMAREEPTGPRPSPPYDRDPRNGAPGAGQPWRGNGAGEAYGPPVRGGHPEQREPGGGWGADSLGHGPGAERSAGRVLQGAPGAAARAGQGPGPRQEYLDAFDEDFFGSGAARSVRAPAPRHPRAPGPWDGHGHGVGPGDERRNGFDPLRRPGGPQGPGTGPGRFAPPGRGPGGPGPRPAWDDEEGRNASTGSMPRVPAPAQEPPRPPKKSGKGRVFTGVLALAVTTVLAVVISGQVAGGGANRAGAGQSDDRGQSEGGTTSRSQEGRDAPGAPRKAAPSYAEQMSEVLPLKADFKGEGTFTAVKGGERGAKGGEVLRYRVDVEKGLPLEAGLFARAVHETLNDRRSWAHDGERSFERVDGKDPDFVITLASAPTTDVWCAKSGLDTSQERVSCDSASTDRIMINGYRWAQGAKTFGDHRMYSYRQMLINHEVGHRIGLNHVGCDKDGALAPVMMQQTKTVTSGDATCKPNAWPFPKA